MSKKKDEVLYGVPHCCVVFEPGKKPELIYGHFTKDGFREGPPWKSYMLCGAVLLVCVFAVGFYKQQRDDARHAAINATALTSDVIARSDAQQRISADQVSKVPIWYADKMEIHMPLDVGSKITIDGKNYIRLGDGIWHYMKPKPVKKTEALPDDHGGAALGPDPLGEPPISPPPSVDEVPRYGPRGIGTGAVDGQ